MKNLIDTFGIILEQIKKWYKEDFAKSLLLTIAGAGFYLICIFVFPSLAFRGSSGLGLILTGVLTILVFRCTNNNDAVPKELKRNVETKQSVIVLTVCMCVLYIILAALRIIQAQTFTECETIAFASIITTGFTVFVGMILIISGTRYIIFWVLCCIWLIADNILGPIVPAGSVSQRTLIGSVIEKTGLFPNSGILCLLCGLFLVILGGLLSYVILDRFYAKQLNLILKNLLGKTDNLQDAYIRKW